MGHTSYIKCNRWLYSCLIIKQPSQGAHEAPFLWAKYIGRDQQMDILNTKTDLALLQSMVGEIAKAKNEIACAKGDLEKANSRLGFLLVVANRLIERKVD